MYTSIMRRVTHGPLPRTSSESSVAKISQVAPPALRDESSSWGATQATFERQTKAWQMHLKRFLRVSLEGTRV